MTLRLPMFLAASFFLTSHAAYGSPVLDDSSIRVPATATLISTNTDEVRARVAKHSDSPIRIPATATLISTNTDEVRAQMANRANSPIRIPATATLIATNTDEVRAFVGGAARVPPGLSFASFAPVAPTVVRSVTAAAPAESINGDSRMTACAKSCPCRHG